MQIICKTDILVKALQILSKVTNTSATLESLRGVLISVNDGNVSVSATNLEVGVNVKIPATDTEDGSVLINPKILIDAVRYSNSNMVTLSKTEGGLNVKFESGETKIKVLNESEFPNISKDIDGVKVEIKIKKIVDGVRSVLYAASNSIIKPELSSVYIWQDGGELVFVATDSFRLAEKRVKHNISNLDDLSVLIPHKNIQTLIGILEQYDFEDGVYMYIDRDQCAFVIDGGNVYVTLRAINGAFPDYRKILPKDPSTQITVLKEDLSNIVKKAGVFADEFDKITLNADLESKKLIISTSNGKYGDTKDELSGVLEGESVKISVNHRYVSDCLSVINSDSVVMSFFGKDKPIIIKGVGDKSFTYLVMPMNV